MSGSLSDEIEQTVASLDALHAPRQARRAAWLDGLRAVVARLDAPLVMEPEEEAPEPRRRQPEREISQRDVELALQARERGAHGEFAAPRDFGPEVRRKLVRAALEEPRW